MSKGTYLSIYLGKDEIGLIKALSRMAKKHKSTRNNFIRLVLTNLAWFAGELSE